MIKFPKHKCGLYLEHNAHKDLYEPIEQYLEDYKDDDWISLEDKELSYRNNEYWKLQWYPDTPVGFHVLLFGSFKSLLEYLKPDEQTQLGGKSNI